MMVTQQASGWPKLVAFGIIVLIVLAVAATLSAADLPGQFSAANAQNTHTEYVDGLNDVGLAVEQQLIPDYLALERAEIQNKIARDAAIANDMVADMEQENAFQEAADNAAIQKDLQKAATLNYLARAAGIMVSVIVTFTACTFIWLRLKQRVPKAALVTLPAARTPAPPPTRAATPPPARPAAPVAPRPVAPPHPAAPTYPTTPPLAQPANERLMPLREPLREQPTPLPELNLTVGDTAYRRNGHVTHSPSANGVNGHGKNSAFQGRDESGF